MDLTGGMSTTEPLVSGGTIARYFGVTSNTIATWADEGKIPVALTTPGGHRRYRIAEVLDALGMTEQAS